jgi:hypothetical protein
MRYLAERDFAMGSLNRGTREHGRRSSGFCESERRQYEIGTD